MTTPDYVNSLDGHYWTDGQTLTAGHRPVVLALHAPAACELRCDARGRRDAVQRASAQGGADLRQRRNRRRVRRAAGGDHRHRAGEFAGGLAGNARPGRVGQRGVLFQGLRGGRRRQDRHGADRRQGQQRRVRGVRALRRSADRAGGGDRKGRQRRRAGLDRGADPQRPTSPRWTRRRRSWAKICSSSKRRKRSPAGEAASLRALYFFCLRISSPKKGRMR